jgi:hypothetical protein
LEHGILKRLDGSSLFSPDMASSYVYGRLILSHGLLKPSFFSGLMLGTCFSYTSSLVLICLFYFLTSVACLHPEQHLAVNLSDLFDSFKMAPISRVFGLVLGAVALVAAIPTPTAAPEFNPAVLNKRASCTFTDASEASASKKSCATIVLDNIAVPSGTTLDLTDLTSGTSVVFDGETTWGYEEWSGPLLSISGEDIAISGNSGHSLNGGGAQWWDGEGSNGGKTKPKFFYAHSLTGSSSITGLNILNTPVQSVSVDGSDGLTITDMTIDNSAGDEGSLGHNTDAFDVGSTTGLTITGATVKNQDDCLAINSGSVSSDHSQL